MARDLGRTVIVGAGLAGAATAFGLVRRGVRDIVLLEQEGIPGYYASGRNAGMIRQLEPQSEIRRLVRRSLQFFESPPPPFPGPTGFCRSGSLLLAAGREASDLVSWVDSDKGVGPEVRFLSPREVKNRIDAASAAAIETAAFTASDGIADAHTLLQGMLAAARSGGAEIRFRAKVSEVLTRDGSVSAIRMESGDRVACSTLVNAAGPWAGKIANLAGALRLPFAALRRHLTQTQPLPWVDPAGPFVWDITHGVYYRPESGGVLLCGCDEDPLEPCDPPVDSRQLQNLAQKVELHFPAFKNAQIRRSWACLRTFVPDRGLVIGYDPGVKGFFWCAALGGYGVGIAPALTELVPDLMLEGESSLLENEELNRISLDRFMQPLRKEP